MDDLSAPLGQGKTAKRRLVLPIRASHVVAGALALCIAVFAGWAMVADDPLGGEPMAVIPACALDAQTTPPATIASAFSHVTSVPCISASSSVHAESPCGPG